VDPEGKTIYHKCVNPQSDRGNTKKSILSVLDTCGKPIAGSTDDALNMSDFAAAADQAVKASLEGEAKKLNDAILANGIEVFPENETEGQNSNLFNKIFSQRNKVTGITENTANKTVKIGLQVLTGVTIVNHAKNPMDPASSKQWSTKFNVGESYARTFKLVEPTAFVKAGGFLGKRDIQMSEAEIREALASDIQDLSIRPINGTAKTATYFYSTTEIGKFGITPASVIKVSPVTNAGQKIK
jgi:hypothetical protein